jgi:hypothetical protein
VKAAVPEVLVPNVPPDVIEQVRVELANPTLLAAGVPIRTVNTTEPPVTFGPSQNICPKVMFVGRMCATNCSVAL